MKTSILTMAALCGLGLAGCGGNSDSDSESLCKGSIGNFVWNDLNGNGIQDPGEPGIGGVTVVLKDANGAMTKTTTTDAADNYDFDQLCTGSYSVSVNSSSPPLQGFSPSPEDKGTPKTDSNNPNGTAVKLADNTSSDQTIDFGYYRNVASVEFIGMPAPATDQERATTYTTASAKITYADGQVEEYPLNYKALYYNTDTISGVTGGQVYDVTGAVLKDTAGVPFVAQTPDSNSLIKVDGAPADTLYLVTHFEYVWLDSIGSNIYGKAPMVMKLATVQQNPATGDMTVTGLKNVDMASVRGLWIPCAGSLSPWNTHLGSEEYEPDARCLKTDTCKTVYPNPNSDFMWQMYSMERYYGNNTTAKPYNYGLTPEVKVNADGSYQVAKHRAPGRISRELIQMLPDKRTGYQGDDGTYNVITMFVANQETDLSSGTLYAAQWKQTSADNGGAADLTWIRLGSATDAELDKMVNVDNIQFSNIFEVDVTGCTKIKAGHDSAKVECLKVKPGMEKAAAFLETRRYAGMLGATTEFEKVEGVTANIADRIVYYALTRTSAGMEAANPVDATLPDDIKLPKNLSGAVWALQTTKGVKDSQGNPINSDWVAVTMKALVVGKDIPKDAVGNTSDVESVANADNIKFSEVMRTLFIGEDSSTAHINNFLWAYNVDTGKLSRILSVVAGAESTGLQVVEYLAGHGYIMSNYQHAGDFSSNINAELKARLAGLIDRQKAAVGYLGGLPGVLK